MAEKTPRTRLERYIRLIESGDLHLVPSAVQAVIVDTNRVLMVNSPTYEEHWTLPGGEVDTGDRTRESALERELKEELGLSRVSARAKIGRLLAVNINEPREGRPFPLVDYLYKVELTGPPSLFADRPQFALQTAEIAQCRFVPQHLAPEWAGKRKGGRLAAALSVIAAGGREARLVEGKPVPDTEYQQHADHVQQLNDYGTQYYLDKAREALRKL